jgi:hypothetical protein
VNCRVIFDVTEAGYRGWPVAGVGALLLLSALAVAYVNRHAGFGRRWGFFAGVAIVVAIISVFCVVEFVSARRSLQNGDYQIAEGYIQEYHALPARAKGRESFTVAGKTFEFSEFALMPGFSWTRRKGSPLEKGSFVRIAYRSRQILRVELCESRR